MARIIELFWSPFEPREVSRKWFILGNWIFIVAIVAAHNAAPAEIRSHIQGKTSSMLWHIWIVFFALLIIILMLKVREQAWRYLNLFLYAYNRRLVFLIFLNVLYFPIEVLLIKTTGIEFSKLMQGGTLLIKIVTYLYFYRLVMLLLFEGWKTYKANSLTLEAKK